jgi:hypothetical protein
MQRNRARVRARPARIRHVGRGAEPRSAVGVSRSWVLRLTLEVLGVGKQGGFDGISGLSLLSGEHMGIDLQREGHGRVSEAL